MTAQSKMKVFVLRAITVVMVLAVIAAVAVGVRVLSDDAAGEDNAGGGWRGSQPAPVEVVDVELRNLRETIRGIGTLHAERTVHLSPETDGMLIAAHFREGDLIEQGELLFELDDRKLNQRLQSQQSALRAARARLDIARSTYHRVQRLREQNVASTDEYDRARTDLDAAIADVEQFEANVALVEEELKDIRLHAPFTGVMSERFIDPGNYVQVGNRLATLYRIDPLEMSFRLPERHLGRVRIGQTVEVMVASRPHDRFEGQVTFIGPAVNEQTRDVLVKARIDNPDTRLTPGSFGTAVVIVAEHHNRPVVPEEAIIPTRTGHSVFVIGDENRARMTRVTIGIRTNGMVEITDGLTGGETVVRTGQLRVNDGRTVEIVNRQRDNP